MNASAILVGGQVDSSTCRDLLLDPITTYTVESKLDSRSRVLSSSTSVNVARGLIQRSYGAQSSGLSLAHTLMDTVADHAPGSHWSSQARWPTLKSPIQ